MIDSTSAPNSSEMDSSPKLCFLGAGNMATSIIKGLIEKGYCPEHILAIDRNPHKLEGLKSSLGIQVNEEISQTTLETDILFLAVKPQGFPEACRSLAPLLNQCSRSPLIVSVAAGITSSTLEAFLNQNAIAIVRSMPNTPALVKQGATGLYANRHVTEAQKKQVSQLFESVGLAIWVDSESKMDAITALSGSGPAYFFLLMESMIKAGEELGLSRDEAMLLTLQTARGAAEMAHVESDSPDVLRQKVTSPGGTTQRAIEAFQAQGFESSVLEALTAAALRSRELSQ